MILLTFGPGAVSVTNPRNYTTTFDFNDRFGTPDSEARSNTPPTELGSLKSYAFATLVTNPLEHTAYTQDDYYLGKPVNGEDANGAVAFGRYDDALDRPTRLVVAEGTVVQRQTTYSYNDAARTIATRSDLNTYGDNLLTNELLYDGLGRTVETRKYAPEGTIKTTQVYDAVGRVKRTYNPHINSSEPTYGWTETTYDALSRVTRVETLTDQAYGPALWLQTTAAIR